MIAALARGSVTFARISPPMRILVGTAGSLAAIGLLVVATNFEGLAPIVHSGPLLLALALIVAGQVLSGARWWLALRTLGSERRARWGVRHYLSASAYNQLLPTGIGGDAVRVGLAAPDVGFRRAAAAVALDRGLGVLWLGTAALAAALAAAIGAPAVLLAAGLLLSVLGVLILAGSRLERMMIGSSRESGEPGMPWLLLGAISTTYLATLIGALMLITAAFGGHVSWELAATALLVVTLAATLPINVGGWGLREATFVLLLGGAIGTREALTVGVALGGMLAVAGAVGLAWAPTARTARTLQRIGTREVLAGGAIFVIAVGVRVVGLTDRGLWLDEAIAVRQAGLPTDELLQAMASNIHPPLFHLMLGGWIGVFGSSEAAVRTMTVLFGVMTVPAVWWVANVIFGKRAGWYAATLMAVAPFAVWYSQELRMYAPLMLFAAVGVGALWKYRQSERAVWAVLYVLVRVATIYTHYSAWLLIASELLALALTQRGGIWERARVSARLLLPLLIAIAPWAAMVALHQPSGLVSPPILPRPDVYSLLNSAFILVFGFWPDGAVSLLLNLWPVLILLVFAAVGVLGRFIHRWVFVAVVAVGPVALIFGASLSLPASIYDERYFSVAFPAMVVGVSAAASGSRSPPVALTAAVLALATLSISQSFLEDNPKRYGYREAHLLVAEQALPGDTLVIAPAFLEGPLADYYDFGSMPVVDPQSVADAIDAGEAHGRYWLVTSFEDVPVSTEGLTAAQAVDHLRSRLPLIQKVELPNVVVRLYGPSLHSGAP